MIDELHIENLAVIENATVSLCQKLNLFTGETGAGKSILIGGINAVLGQRISKDMIREGSDKAYVSAVFTNLPSSAVKYLADNHLECNGELIISREISRDGRSSARINSRPVNLTVLKEVGDMLVNIYGQHDSSMLLDPDKHLNILDSFAESYPMLDNYRKSFRELQTTAKEINKLKIEARSRAQRADYLNMIISEIGELDVKEGEDEAIEERFRFADNAVSVSEALMTAITCISGDEGTTGAGELVAKACTEIENNEELLKSLPPISKRLSDLGIELGDISNELSDMLSELDINEAEYSRLSARRDQLTRIKRRYGPSLNDVIELYKNSKEELYKISASDDIVLELEQKKTALLTEVTKKAEALSEFRLNASKRFIDLVCAELAFLNMPDIRLAADFKKGKLTLNGMDSVEFLISANRGEAPKPLAKIASGGELSRIMLALKTVLADRDDIPTLIFDEIDTGVSGRAAQKIGIKLREISRKRQVICVTHLPQIAIMADNHMLIEKNIKSDRTVTEIKTLSFDERTYEIARILGGDNITDTVLQDAKEQLRSVMSD